MHASSGIHCWFTAGPKDHDEQTEHHQGDEQELAQVGKSITELPQPSPILNPPEVTLTFFSNLLQ
jgi:hypothetical protein